LIWIDQLNGLLLAVVVVIKEGLQKNFQLSRNSQK
jgi:hypothetical protein